MIDYSKKTLLDGNPNSCSVWHKAVLKLFSFKNNSIVDIGCGSGSFLLAIKKEAGNIVGIDPNNKNCEEVKTHGIIAINDYPENITEYDTTFDIATCFEVVEHLYTHTDIVHSMAKMLRSGGQGIISTPNAFNIVRTIVFLFKQEHHDLLLDPTRTLTPEHIRLWSYGMMKRICDTEPTLKVDKIYGIGIIFGKLYIFTNKFFTRLFSQHLIVILRKN